MSKQVKNGIPIFRVKKHDTKKALLARFKKDFTAADLQKYTEIEEGIPLEKIIADMEAIHEKGSRKKKR